MKTVFIVGAQRSGTTLLSVMLGKHPDILMEERSAAFRLISVFKNAQDILPDNLAVNRSDFYHWLIRHDYKGRVHGLLDMALLPKGKSMREVIETSISKKLEESDKVYWADKAPNLQLFLPDLMLLIPDAKIIHIVRDGRANAYSIARRSYQHLQWSAQHWVDVNTVGLLNQDLIGPERYHFIKYEDLLVEPDAGLQKICAFLDLPYSEKMLELGGGAVAEEQRYVKSTLDPGKIDAYRSEITTRQLTEMERIQGPLLRKLNYELLTDTDPKTFRPLSLGRKIAYHQWANFKLLFRSQQEGMRNRKNVQIKLPFRNRLYTFLLQLGQDLLSRSIVRTLFRRTFYKKRFFRKDT